MISEQKQKTLDLYAEGRRFYKLMKFEEAIERFEAAVQNDPTDGPSKVYLDRCKLYAKNPPDEDWDGVFVMTHK